MLLRGKNEHVKSFSFLPKSKVKAESLVDSCQHVHLNGAPLPPDFKHPASASLAHPSI
jgi:hypothetical protein